MRSNNNKVISYKAPKFKNTMLGTLFIVTTPLNIFQVFHVIVPFNSISLKTKFKKKRYEYQLVSTSGEHRSLSAKSLTILIIK